MFMVNSRLSSFAAGYLKGSQPLFLSYGRFFAEFLNESSSDHLRLLASSTCVGLRYGSYIYYNRTFLVSPYTTNNKPLICR